MKRKPNIPGNPWNRHSCPPHYDPDLREDIGMQRRSNLFVWIGFALTLVAFLSYYFYFLRFPSTRDFPWLNLLLFVVAGVLLGVGLKRAYGDSARYRGKISGAILGVLSLAVFVLFCVFNFVLAK